MPSFTLLGSQVIRLPFILASSYPHEILHNWWGNSVFVDYESGNWCEGLTAYMADHLIQEQRGRGRELPARHAAEVPQLRARRARLPARRVPLPPQRRDRGGRLRQDADGLPHAAPQARRRRLPPLGRRASTASRRGRQASFADVAARRWRRSPGADLSRFFRDWTERPGAASSPSRSTAIVAPARAAASRCAARCADAGRRAVRARRAASSSRPRARP